MTINPKSDTVVGIGNEGVGLGPACLHSADPSDGEIINVNVRVRRAGIAPVEVDERVYAAHHKSFEASRRCAAGVVIVVSADAAAFSPGFKVPDIAFYPLTRNEWGTSVDLINPPVVIGIVSKGWQSRIKIGVPRLIAKELVGFHIFRRCPKISVIHSVKTGTEVNIMHVRSRVAYFDAGTPAKDRSNAYKSLTVSRAGARGLSPGNIKAPDRTIPGGTVDIGRSDSPVVPCASNKRIGIDPSPGKTNVIRRARKRCTDGDARVASLHGGAIVAEERFVGVRPITLSERNRRPYIERRNRIHISINRITISRDGTGGIGPWPKAKIPPHVVDYGVGQCTRLVRCKAQADMSVGSHRGGESCSAT